MILYSDSFTKFQFLNGQSVANLGVFFQQTVTDKVRKAALGPYMVIFVLLRSLLDSIL